jgi:hypothetical protein
MLSPCRPAPFLRSCRWRWPLAALAAAGLVLVSPGSDPCAAGPEGPGRRFDARACQEKARRRNETSTFREVRLQPPGRQRVVLETEDRFELSFDPAALAARLEAADWAHEAGGIRKLLAEALARREVVRLKSVLPEETVRRLRYDLAALLESGRAEVAEVIGGRRFVHRTLFVEHYRWQGEICSAWGRRFHSPTCRLIMSVRTGIT